MQPQDPTEVYRRTRERLTDLVGRRASDATRPVPACPGWRVRDVLAHVAGIASDFQDGRLPSGDVATWTAEQVQGRAERSVGQLLQEWQDRAPGFEQAMRGPLVGAAPSFTADVVSHLYDVAGALGEAQDRNTSDTVTALDTFASMLGRRIDAAALRPLLIIAGGGSWVAGSGEEAPVLTVRAETFAALRALSGRRTPVEIAAMDWDGDPGHYAAIISAFPFPEHSLAE